MGLGDQVYSLWGWLSLFQRLRHGLFGAGVMTSFRLGCSTWPSGDAKMGRSECRFAGHWLWPGVPSVGSRLALKEMSAEVLMAGTSAAIIIMAGLSTMLSFTGPWYQPPLTSPPKPSCGLFPMDKPQSLYPREKRVLSVMPNGSQAPEAMGLLPPSVSFTFVAQALSGRADGHQKALRLFPI